MKRCLSIMLALALSLAAVGCGRMHVSEDDKSPLDSESKETLEKEREASGTENADMQPSGSSADFKFEETAEGLMITGYTGALSEVVIPDEIDGKPVIGIAEHAFADRPDLTAITIPDGITELYLSTLTGLKNLQAITVSHSNPRLATEGGVLFDKEKYRLICYPAGKTDSSYIIPDGISEISIWSFSGNPYLKSVIIPDSVWSIGHEAFAGCTALENVILPDGVEDIDESAFSGCVSLKSPYGLQTQEAGTEDFVLPMSSQRPLTYDDIQDLSSEEIALARNEIYARHGYVFQKQKYIDYFTAKSWYSADPGFKESDLSEIEKANVDFLLQYERQ